MKENHMTEVEKSEKVKGNRYEEKRNKQTDGDRVKGEKGRR